MTDSKKTLYNECTEFFEANPNICDTNTKKAWFVLGAAWENALSQKLKINNDTNSYRGYRLSYTKESSVFDKDTFIDIHNECFRLFVEFTFRPPC